MITTVVLSLGAKGTSSSYLAELTITGEGRADVEPALAPGASQNRRGQEYGKAT